MKKRIINVLVVLVCLALMIIGCSQADTDIEETTEESIEETIEETEVATDEIVTEEIIIIDEDTVAEYITGIEDRTVEQGSTNIDYLAEVIYDEELIVSVTVDDSAVDYETPGEYEVIYTIDYIANEGLETEVTEAVTITIAVTVVSEEDAQALADEGEVVLTSDNEVKTESEDNASEVVVEEDKEAYSEQVLVTAAYDEQVLVTAEVTETVEYIWATASKVTFSDANGGSVTSETITQEKFYSSEDYKNWVMEWVSPNKYQACCTTKTETIVVSPAVYETVHHDAVYETVTYDAVTHQECSGCGATK